jgi:hypothetical protein
MRRLFTKKRSFVALTAVVVLAIAGAAFAFVTSTGSGTGSANVGTDPGGNWSVTQTAHSGTLFPDGPGTGGAVGNGNNLETVTYDVTNGSTYQLGLSSVTAAIAGSGGSTWSSQTNNLSLPACTASDFSINGKAVGTSATDTTLAGDVKAGATTSTNTFKIEMIDNGLNQDNCEGLSPPIYYTAN